MTTTIRHRTTRILFDLHACQTAGSAQRGVGRYSLALWENVHAHAGDREVMAMIASGQRIEGGSVHVNTPKLVSPSLPTFGTVADHMGGDADSISGLLLGSQVARAKPDVIHVSHVFEGFSDRTPLIGRASVTSGQVLSTTLYDLIPLRFPEHYFRNEAFERWYRNRCEWLRRADLLLAISESSRQDALELLDIAPERVVTVHGGVGAHFRPSEDVENERRRLSSIYGITRNFVLFTGGDDFRKNISGMIKGFAALPKAIRGERQLVIVCALEAHRGAMYEEVAREAGLEADDVRLIGFVPEDDLVALYQACELFVFPSLYEGLGLPVIEAMACGAPTIGGANSSIAEIIGREDATFDATDANALATKMAETLVSVQRKQELSRFGRARAEAFTWQETAERAISAFDAAVERKQAAGTKAVRSGWLPRRRLAMVTPLPPTRSGIADYNAQFLPYLAEHFDIDVFVEEGAQPDVMLSSAFRVSSVSDFRDHAANYYAILYEFGNSEFHAHMPDLLREFPGVVGLHDAYLSGMYGYLQFNLGQENRYFDEVLSAHGTQARAILAPAAERIDPLVESIIELPTIKNVLDEATGVISHSPFNLEVARSFHPERWRAPFQIIPQMIVADRHPGAKRDAARARLGFEQDEVVITTFGHVIWYKLGDRLLEGFAQALDRSSVALRLVFAGELPSDGFGEQLKDAIGKSEFRDRIRLTGFLSAADYKDYLQATDIAVQLRTKSRGGTPRGVLDCLAQAVPTIVNNDASYRDYPDNVVYKLATDPPSEEVATAILALSGTPEARRRLGKSGHEYVRDKHDPRLSAAMYAQAIHEFTERTRSGDAYEVGTLLAPHLASCEEPQTAAQAAARVLDREYDVPYRRRKIYIDVSHIDENDHGTGIQRVVRNIVEQAYLTPLPGIEAIAVILDNGDLVPASNYLSEHSLLAPGDGAATRIEFRENDILLMLDSSWARYLEFIPALERARDAGAKIVSVVYDLLPITLPPNCFVPGGREWFEGWLRMAIEQTDSFICISKSCANDLTNYLEKGDLARHGLKVGHWRLGADVPQVSQSTNDAAIDATGFSPYVLMVGTFEPRKNHALTLDAFERLWEKGSPLSLVMVGRKGWNYEEFIERAMKHRYLNKKLHLLFDVEDDVLSCFYKNADAVIMPSLNEGFGLPIVEAAVHGIDVICSDIDVFREIAGNGAFFVSIDGAKQLADGIATWWQKFNVGETPRSSAIDTLSWRESYEDLVSNIQNN